MSFVLRASSSLWASSSSSSFSSSSASVRRRGGGRLRGGHYEGRRHKRGLKTLSASDVTDDDAEAATTEKDNPPTRLQTERDVVVNEGNESDDNPFLGAAEEIGVIEWPTAGKALQTTGVVIVGIVLSSVFLLVVNEALSALSGKIFS